MPIDPQLADRLRELVADHEGIDERRMFGSVAFLVHGNLAIAASGKGGIMLRVDPEEGAALLASTEAYPMVMRGRELAGWLRVAPEHLHDDEELATWVARGLGHASSLPPKDVG